MNDQDIFENRMKIYSRDYFVCQFKGCTVCGADNLQLAHRISKGHSGVNWVKNYIYREYCISYKDSEIKRLFINNTKNMITSCAKHNDYFNCLNKPEEAKKIIDDIMHDILG